MEKIRCLFTILAIVIFCEDNLQSQSGGTEKMDLLIKVRLLEYMNNIDSISDITQFLLTDLKYKILENHGFSDDIIFIEVPISLEESTHYKFFLEYNFVLAYRKTSSEIFKLKGFETNEFGKFLATLGPLDFDIKSGVIQQDMETYKSFKKAFWVENLDVNCLYRSITKRKKNTTPCLEPAG